MSKYEPRRSRTPSPKPPRQRFSEEWGLRDVSHRAAILTPVGAGVLVLAGLAIGSELSGGGSPPVVASHHVLTGRPPAHVQQPVLSASLIPPILAAKYVAPKHASAKTHVRVARHAARSAPRPTTVWVASHPIVAATPAVSHASVATSTHTAARSAPRLSLHSSSPTIVASVPTSSPAPVVVRHPSAPSHRSQPVSHGGGGVGGSGHRGSSGTRSSGHSQARSPQTHSTPVSSSSSPTQAVVATASVSPAAKPAPAASTPAATPAAAAQPAPQSFSQANAVTPSTGGDAPAAAPAPAPAPAPTPAPKPVVKSGNGWTSTVGDKPKTASVGASGLILSLVSVGVGGGVMMNRRRRDVDWRTGR